MLDFILVVIAIVGLLEVMRREAGARAALGVLGVFGLAGWLLGAPWTGTFLLIAAAILAVPGLPALRQRWLTPRIFALFDKAAPSVSDTLGAALE
ncbi:MAG: acyl-CoA dehydrogenase, partial [Halomonas sp.]|nr:acyl-CoA dehydrogenase [Halomonas sp.]